MSQISLKSISGITSITTPAGVDNQFTLHTNNTSQALKLDSAGNIHIHNHVNTTGISSASNFKTGSSNLHSTGLSVASIDVGSNIKLGNAGVITATSYRGDGSQLTGIVADKIFEGNTEVETIDTGSDGHVKITTEGTERLRIQSTGVVNIGDTTASALGDRLLQIGKTDRSATYVELRTATNGVGGVVWSDGTDNSNTGYRGTIEYAHGGSNSDSMFFKTAATERLRINSSGHVVPGTDSAYDLGLTGTRFRNVYADTLYGSGANLTGLVTPLSFRNLLINGDMQINQRGSDHGVANSFNPVTGNPYTLDRWKVLNSNSFDTDSAKVVQDSVAPTSEGFRKSIMMNIGNTETPSSTQVCGFQQKIEGQNLQSLAYGTSSAKTTTLSFWVYSNKTGTYCVQIMQDDVNKYVLYEYTISAQNTWEKKTITIAGNTSDAIDHDNGIGLEVNWILCVGSGRQASATSSWTSGGYYVATSNQVNLWDHADNYFKMTGCQLEVGTVATPFEHRSFSEELQRCLRYYEKSFRYATIPTNNASSSSINMTGSFFTDSHNNSNRGVVRFQVEKRASPSLTKYGNSQGRWYSPSTGFHANNNTANGPDETGFYPRQQASGSVIRMQGHYAADAEL